MERFREYQLIGLGLSLMVGLIVASAIAANGLIAFKKAETQVISVTGAASEFINSDFVKWQPTISRRAGTTGEAYSQLQKDAQVVQKYLLDKGLAPGEIKIQPPQIETLYSRAANGDITNNVEGYTVRQTFDIQTKNVAKVERLASEAMELSNRGIYFETETPQYFYTKLDDIKVKMLALATENAKQRAQAMAKSTGNHIGPMRSSQMGVFQITPKFSTDVSDYGVNDTSTPDKKVTAVVNVTFALE
jgi:hypothetical protein